MLALLVEGGVVSGRWLKIDQYGLMGFRVGLGLKYHPGNPIRMGLGF